MRDGFFNPDMLYEVQMIDEMMRGLVSTPMENQDQFMSGPDQSERKIDRERECVCLRERERDDEGSIF